MLFAHKEHGFSHFNATDGAALAKDGWEPCDDVLEFKRRAWGIGVAEPATEAPAEEAPRQKRKWTRKAAE